MKKLLAILLTLALVFSFAACGENNPTQTGEEFQKPETYASVILLTINPQFRLYLSAEGEVLAVEPVNDDAKSIAKSISVQTGSIEQVVDNIVTATNNGGFVKSEDVTVNLSVVEVADETVNTTTVLQKVETATNESFKNLEVTVEVVLTDTEKDQTTSSDESSSEETHEHSFAAATCTSAKTCACGAKEGSALGHNYKDGTCSRCNAKDPNYTANTHKHSFAAATCTSAKICACGAKEGSALGHNYIDGICSRCGAKDPNAKTALSKKSGNWKGMFWVESDGMKTYYELTVNFANKVILYGGGGTARDIMGEEFYQESIDNGEAFFFDGEWWVGGFGGAEVIITNITESGNTVTMVTEEGTATFTRTGENTLEVASCTPGLICGQGIKAKTVLTYK